MDVFGGSPSSQLNKTITDMKEKFAEQLDSHVNLIGINYSKIVKLDEKFTNELGLHTNLITANDEKISSFNDRVLANEMQIIRLGTIGSVQVTDKYFLENNNKIESCIESIEDVNKYIKDLKVSLAHAYARIIILEDRFAENSKQSDP